MRWLILLCALLSARVAIAGETGEGRLVTRVEGKLVDVPLEHTDVRIRVDGPVAETVVVQRFKNPGTAKIEAVYLFPLPTAAAVHDLAIASNGRVTRGQILERAAAKQVYDIARSRGWVAALLTQERPNLFTQSIANLEPGATVDVTIKYAQRLDYEDGGYTVVFPMVASPRYLPAAWKDKAPQLQAPTLPPGLRSTHDIALTVDIDAGVAIEDIGSPSHQIAIARDGKLRARVAIKAGDTIPNKDFVLRYRVAGTAPKVGVVAHRDGAEGSFLLMVQPPAQAAPETVAPRELVLVLDTSSSMRGPAFTKARELAKRLLWTLRPDDTFQIVRFSDTASALGPGPIANKPANVKAVLAWLDKLEAGGGTEMTTGIATALAVPHDPLRLRIVAFITDGYVGNEDDVLATVGKQLGASRLFAFGVGTAVNRYLLEEMATVGRGSVQFVRPDEDTGRAINAFERRIGTPVLTDLRVDWSGVTPRDIVPRAIPDLFAGQPLMLAGHYTAGGVGSVTVSGKQNNRPVSFTVPIVLPVQAARPAIGMVWARSRIAELSRQLVRKPDPAVEKQIVALSLDHRVLTRFTAFVAVDDSKTTTGDAKRVVVPVEVPDAARSVSHERGGTWWGGYGAGYGGSGLGYSGGTGYMARTVTVPTVTIASPMVQGDLDKAIIRRYIRRNTAKITYCYEKRLLAKPKLEGTVTAQFVITPAGMVAASSASGVDAEVASCIADVIKRIEFPKAVNGGTITVSYPFELKPSEQTRREAEIKEWLR